VGISFIFPQTRLNLVSSEYFHVADGKDQHKVNFIA